MTRHAELLPSALLASHFLGVTTTHGPSAQPTSTYYHLGDPGQPAKVPTLLIAIFDDSGSVISVGGTDPLSNRYAEARRAFAFVARHGSRRELGAVLHFDTPRGDIGPIPLTRLGMRRLLPSLGVPRGAAGSSRLAPSLQRARAFAEAHPQHATTLVVFSDLLLLDVDPGVVLTELAAFSGDVHVVVLGSCVTPAELDGRVTLTHVDRSDPPGAVARALFTSLISHRPGSYVIPQ
jgi:hypothetical protein